MGKTEVGGEPFCRLTDGSPDGCAAGRVWGTYLHGLFDTGALTAALAAYLCGQKGIEPSATVPLTHAAYQSRQLDLLADGVRKALDMAAIYQMLEE